MSVPADPPGLPALERRLSALLASSPGVLGVRVRRDGGGAVLEVKVAAGAQTAFMGIPDAVGPAPVTVVRACPAS